MINAKKSLIISLLFIVSLTTYGQKLKKKKFIGFIPALNTRINGIAIGLLINSFKSTDDNILTTQVNGVSLEIIGTGLFLPIGGSDPIYSEPDSIYNNLTLVDSITKIYTCGKYQINGFAISAGGVAGYDVLVNGVNLSVINTLTARLNGFSTAVMFNMSWIMNGVSVGLIGNQTLKTNGVQIGFFNKTTVLNGLQLGVFNQTRHLKGVQIGLWNNNGKRKLPIINWKFK